MSEIENIESKPKIPDKRKYQIVKKEDEIRLMWACRDPEHEQILLFKNINDRNIHLAETGHKTEYLEVEIDANLKKELELTAKQPQDRNKPRGIV